MCNCSSNDISLNIPKFYLNITFHVPQFSDALVYKCNDYLNSLNNCL